MVKCEMCGKEVEEPKKSGGKLLCEDCYVEMELEYANRYCF